MDRVEHGLSSENSGSERLLQVSPQMQISGSVHSADPRFVRAELKGASTAARLRVSTSRLHVALVTVNSNPLEDLNFSALCTFPGEQLADAVEAAEATKISSK